MKNKKLNTNLLEGFVIGGLFMSGVTIFATKHLFEKKYQEKSAMDDRFKNKKFRENYDYVKELALYYNRKSNRAKASKNYNDMKKYNLISKLLLEKSKELSEKQTRDLVDRWILLNRK